MTCNIVTSKSYLKVVGNRLVNGLENEGFLTGLTSFNRICEEEESDDSLLTRVFRFRMFLDQNITTETWKIARLEITTKPILTLESLSIT